ncbi:hypothetical protein F5B22DRAFT_254178 [Xylaria bambusicola]|uniref:uncharacterized protein n=1 Tax=Xylaria bambusicola TaxID=326684 RepID=UPI002007F6E9|nr:uncharacterized protein F5B22DRAFT_254178 [Xylaria bambusicola]KAI0525782.1 hypothetical protein F5B22DRAFT_254178 [Xylaria bambusicola]
MATAPSQSPAHSANAPTSGAVRPPSTNTAGPSLSDSPDALAPSFSAPSTAANGIINGLHTGLVTTVGRAPTHLDGCPGAELRIYPRDGRVRNPVPSKLKNVNDNMKGNFGVMHMDVASHRASEGRDAAAKRTSEGTLLQAKLAQTDGYVSHQRRANYPRPPGLKQFTSPKRSVEPVLEPGPPQPLTVAETKAEQARLLTLLRTLPHYTVVDQICRGLAFFGGVPDAPPPADGKFPESALANGSGSLFVGWIAEIFPDLENPRPKYVEDAAAQSSSQKRRRGRPKGSKARKTRSDKGIKKGPQKANKGGEDQAQGPQDDSWVDVEDSVLELNDDGDLVEAMTALRNAPSTPTTGSNGGGATTATAAKGSAAGFRSINDNGLTPGSSAKKRGRPKGSKNRPKDKSVLQSIPPPKVTPVPVPVPMLDAHPKTKTSSAKSKSTKNRLKPAADVLSDTAIAHATQQHTEPSITETGSSTQARTSAPDFADRSTAPTVNGSNTHTEEGHQSVQPTKPPLPSPASQVKASTVTAKKRKRPTGNGAGQAESIPPSGATLSNSQHTQSNANVVASSSQHQDQASQHVRQATPSSVGIPQAKRARKSQESSSTATVRRQTPNNMSQKASNPPVSTHAEPVQQPSSEDGAQLQPQAEGLEAHYAAMQSHTDQIQSYNSRPQHKQQPQSTSSMGSTVSPTPATAAVPAASSGLDAHYDHFAALQSLSENSRQTNTARQKQQQQTQTASPIAAQSSKLPQMSPALTSQQQSRTPQNYYSQGQGLGSSYNSQQQSYSTTQRSQQHMSNTSSSSGLQHVTNSPQFSTQSNSPLMQTDNNYRGSPSLMHNNTSFSTRRPPSVSPMDNSPAYRSTSATNHGVANHSPHFGARQTSTTSTGHNTSHSGLSSTFPTFSDSSLFDMTLDSGGSHSNMGMSNSSYTLNNGAVSQQQRSSSANSAPLYSSSGMNSTYLGSTNMGRAGQQNRWAS